MLRNVKSCKKLTFYYECIILQRQACVGALLKKSLGDYKRDAFKLVFLESKKYLLDLLDCGKGSFVGSCAAAEELQM